MKPSKTCAYCGRLGPLTKEHIWPKNLIARNDMSHVFNPATADFYKGEAVIRDVCEACNSGPLSKLDNYLSDVFESQFANFVPRGATTDWVCSYETLLRSLLKISFNASRSSKNQKNTRTLKQFSRFILEGGYRPNVMLRLQLVTPSRRTDSSGADLGEINPKLLRSAAIAYDGRLASRFILKLVAINSYWFYLAAAHKAEPSHIWREFEEGLDEWKIPLGVRVDAKTEKLTIPPELTTWFDPNLLFQNRQVRDLAHTDIDD